MTTIREEIVLNHHPCRVWEEFSPKEISGWYQGQPKVRFEILPGDRFRYAGSFKLLMKNGKVDLVLDAEAATMPDGVTFAWSHRNPKQDWRVLWRLEPLQETGGTKLVVVDDRNPGRSLSLLAQRLFLPGILRRRYRRSLKKLQAKIAGAKPR